MVYVAEGCIHCHSKYHRRGSIDDTYWRVSESFPLQEQPVLIGNRRQGPDLTDVGSRRSAAWLREHFLSPRTFYPNSIMPSYGHLFQDQRGDDLIAYLTQNINPQPMRLREVKLGDAQYGKMLFQQQCSACHGTMGLGNGPVAKNLLRPPTNLQTGPFVWSAGEGAFLHKRLAGIVRDGIPGTDMPGHETWTDEQVANVVAYIVKLRSADP
jgi:cytochrome c oxidase cbb3-type subunit 2